MHFEVPKAKTFKEFGGEYLMIVISILTALALEAAFEKVHHNHLAHDAAEQIDAEIRLNIADVKEVLAHNNAKETALAKARKEMLVALRDHMDDAAFMERFNRDWHEAVSLSMKMPSLRREAWEAAVASQAVSWMARPRLQKYANVYAGIRDIGALLHGGSVTFLDAPRMQDVFSNVQIGMGNPKDIYRTVTQLTNAYSSIDGNLKSLQTELEAAVAQQGH